MDGREKLRVSRRRDPRGLASAGLFVVAIAWPLGVAAQERRVSLADVLEHADEHAPEILVARARLAEGRAEREGAEPLVPDPLAIEVGVGPRITEQSEDVDVSLRAVQPIEIGGARGMRFDLAARISAQRGAELELARWQTHREVHFAFHEAIEMRLRREAAARWLALAERAHEIALARERAGEAGSIETLLAAGERARALQALVHAETELALARLELCRVSGWPASDPPLPAGDLDAPVSIASADRLVALAIAEHPALIAHEAAVEEALARSALAEREAWPRLEVGVTLAREGSAGGPANYLALATLGIGIPLSMPNALERARTIAAVEIARARAEALRSSIEARVRRAHAAVVGAARRVEVFQEGALPRFEQSLEQVGRAYELGEIDAGELVLARAQVMEVEGDALDAFAEYHRALADLEAEVGVETVMDESHGIEEER